MIIIVYKNAQRLVSIAKNNEMLPKYSEDVVEEFWRLTIEYPKELIIWVEQEYSENLNTSKLASIFHHNLIMVSYPIKNQFLPDTIGYIDQSPFIYPKLDVTYPTWRMSTDVGGMYSEAAIKFKGSLYKIKDFGYLINSIAKIGQQNSLFCYSSPLLVNKIYLSNSTLTFSSNRELFQFVYQFYKLEWIFVLFFCMFKYDRKFPLLNLIGCLFLEKYYKMEIDLSGVKVISKREIKKENATIDVIIPTLDRAKHLLQVLIDLKGQSLKPKRVIIVEQDPDTDSKTQLSEIHNMDWPFEIVHKFIDEIGACLARNLALNEVKSKWVFFADDDIRIPSKTLEDAIREIQRLGIDALNLNCVQPNESTIFSKIKQWGAFGAGTAIVSSNYALQCRFSEIYEYGFGEDTDFGIQLRSKGADVIYHPNIKITHLKAERGGFRGAPIMPWDNTNPTPKPSPTMMLLVKNHFNIWMQRGYKISLIIKFYKRQPIMNPIKYIRSMRNRWRLSEEWAKRISLNSQRVNS